MNSLTQKFFILLCFLTGWVYAADFKPTFKSECSSVFLSRETHPEIVPVTALSSEWPNIRTGTGIFVGDSQTLAAPLHLAFPSKRSEPLKYSFEDPNTGKSVPLQPFAADLKSDLMLLRTPKNYQSDSFYPLERLVDANEIKGFEEITMAGFPGLLERQWTFSQGTTSSYRNNNGQYMLLMAEDSVQEEWSSGSPVFSRDDSIMGILVQATNAHTAFITPSWDLKNLVTQSDSFFCRTTVCVSEWKKWKQLALSGDREAQFLLGQEAFFSGDHIDGEYERALPWLNGSVEQHYAPAMNLLGNMFENGNGINQSTALAKKHYLKAAEEGNEVAQYNLGLIALKEGDPEGAAKWFSKSARQGFPLSEYEFGKMSFLGYGTEKDYVVAERYLVKTARYGIPIAKLVLGQLYHDQRKFVKAKRWLLEVKHLPEAQYEIGVMLARGTGFERNLQEAGNWYQKAADGGDPWSQLNIGMFYIMGIGKKKDVEKGIFYLTQSAEQDIVSAAHNLGYTFRIRGDFQLAMKWLLKAAYSGNPISQRNVGDMYRNGEGTKDPSLAEKWFLESAQRGYAPAMYDLSEMYKTGEGSVLRNPEKAGYWLKEAQKQDYTPKDPRWQDGGEKVIEAAHTKLTPVSQL